MSHVPLRSAEPLVMCLCGSLHNPQRSCSPEHVSHFYLEARDNQVQFSSDASCWQGSPGFSLKSACQGQKDILNELGRGETVGAEPQPIAMAKNKFYMAFVSVK